MIIACFTIPVILNSTLILRGWLMHAFEVLIVGTWRTVDHHTLMAIPILIICTGRLHTSRVVEDQTVWTLTFIIQGIIDLSISTEGNLITFMNTSKCAFRTCTGVDCWVPYLTIVTINSWRNTYSHHIYFTIWALARSHRFIPGSAISTRVRQTEMTIVDSSNWTLTFPDILIPDHTSIALLENSTCTIV